MKNIFIQKSIVFIFIFMLVCNAAKSQSSWRFAVLGDTHVGSSDTLTEMIPFILADSVDCIIVCGDEAEGGLAASGAQLQAQLQTWQNYFAPFYNQGIGVYAIRGNHEADAHNSISAWNAAFSGAYVLPQNGPAGEENLTYSFIHKNAKFICLDNYINLHTINQNWLNQQLNSNTSAHVFVFGHEPAFKVFHTDCMDDSVNYRNAFWQSMSQAGVRAYFCGHDHFLDVAKVEDGDGDSTNNVYQYLVGTGGGWLMPQYSNYNGNNGSYTPQRIFHDMEHGYSIVEINGDGQNDCNVTLTFKKRTWNNTTLPWEYISSAEIINYNGCSFNGINTIFNETAIQYENPVSNSLIIKFDKEYKGVVVYLYNTLGIEVKKSETSQSESVAMDVRTLPTGVYILKVYADEHVFTGKVLKQ